MSISSPLRRRLLALLASAALVPSFVQAQDDQLFYCSETRQVLSVYPQLKLTVSVDGPQHGPIIYLIDQEIAVARATDPGSIIDQSYVNLYVSEDVDEAGTVLYRDHSLFLTTDYPRQEYWERALVMDGVEATTWYTPIADEEFFGAPSATDTKIWSAFLDGAPAALRVAQPSDPNCFDCPLNDESTDIPIRRESLNEGDQMLMERMLGEMMDQVRSDLRAGVCK